MSHFPTIRNRIIEFRTHYDIPQELVANVIDIPLDEYVSYENGTTFPTLDIIQKLADLYKVTLKEFYGDVPLLNVLNSGDNVEIEDKSAFDFSFSDLSPDEKEIVLRYRLRADKEEILLSLLEKK